MYRVKSNALWHSMPGIVLALQPAGAPNADAALGNIGMAQRMLGSVPVTKGVAPTWSLTDGWGFDGATKYIHNTTIATTGTLPLTVLLAGIADIATTAQSAFCGSRSTSNTSGWMMAAEQWNNTGKVGCTYWGVADYNANIATQSTLAAYALVLRSSTATSWVNNANATYAVGTFGAPNQTGIIIGAGKRSATSPAQWYKGTISAWAMYQGELPGAALQQALWQILHCAHNPAWNAWARQRNYWIVPVQAGAVFQAAWAQRTHMLLGGGMN